MLEMLLLAASENNTKSNAACNRIARAQRVSFIVLHLLSPPRIHHKCCDKKSHTHHDNHHNEPNRHSHRRQPGDQLRIPRHDCRLQNCGDLFGDLRRRDDFLNGAGDGAHVCFSWGRLVHDDVLRIVCLEQTPGGSAWTLEIRTRNDGPPGFARNGVNISFVQTAELRRHECCRAGAHVQREVGDRQRLSHQCWAWAAHCVCRVCAWAQRAL